MKMNSNSIAHELATRLNDLINIPLVSEENEQVFFELIIAILLQLLFDSLDISN
ncbi:MAG: hypothetical protein RBR69_07110 [Candidatus Cloacimonadaceae bacterium]|jgi:acetylornithine deacetylase/succinyl-diaminopimelate desuccinylase-like protein|nr:hypothetical protein [Candidatus Cloacimonadota bacterium]MDY0127881.1 hypothetical protein [Candidatus Cloacimonadaceae bacterium]MCB5255102.1 hypothetical protein [Candidatus Cloacimonadota bacterium]MCK9178462.1 hypothetical protein [Candidatus Cloacimonadota bacterium]MCK9242044.1 hypothetical protein [Candidatus Cloacimonadota bacterium]